MCISIHTLMHMYTYQKTEHLTVSEYIFFSSKYRFVGKIDYVLECKVNFNNA